MSTRIARFALAGLLLLPATALAQMENKSWFVAPFAGSTGGGDATTAGSAVGLSGGWAGRRWIGAEADFAWAPGFFEPEGVAVREGELLVADTNNHRILAIRLGDGARRVVIGG